jgi:type I restriction enzyme S subunit
VWLPQVPGHWVAKRLKYLAAPSRRRLFEKPDDTTYIGLEQIESKTGKLLLDNPVETVESNMGVFDRGDVLFGKLRPYLAKVASPTFAGVCTTEVTVYRPRPEVHGDYLKYQLLTAEFIDFINTMAYGTKMPRVSEEQLGEARLALPPLPEQRAIAAFLDRETARIDALIGHKERLIALLEEKRQAVISHAVTRGLDPGVRLKDSGIPWLGMVPEHWTVLPIKRIVTMCSGENITALSIAPDGEYPVFGGNGLRGYTSNYTHNGEYVLVGRQGALCGNINYASGKFWASEHAVVVTPRRPLAVRWLGETLRSMNLGQYSVSAAQPGLSVERIIQLYLPIPPEPEQHRISARIEELWSQNDQLITRIRDGIARLQEYRTALISAAVTGQIDVRGEVETGEPGA